MKKCNLNTLSMCIISHVDHGKTSLSKYIVSLSEQKKIAVKYFDSLEYERNRSITVHSRFISLNFHFLKSFQFNLIDTPGHLDFRNEVERSLKVSDCALLLIDINEGIKAQTLFYLKKARFYSCNILFAFSKVDKFSADKIRIKSTKILQELKELQVLNYSKYPPFFLSSKSGFGIKKLLMFVSNLSVKLFIFDAVVFNSIFDKFQNQYLIIRNFNNILKIGSLIKIEKEVYKIKKIYLDFLKIKEVKSLKKNFIGYIFLDKKLRKCISGFFLVLKNSVLILKKEKKTESSKIFSRLFPKIVSEEIFIKKIKRLNLLDPSLDVQFINHSLFGKGVLCSFDGLFHLQITLERLKQYFNLEVIKFPPSFLFKIKFKGLSGEKNINNLDNLKRERIEYIKESIHKASIEVNIEYFGKLKNFLIENYEIEILLEQYLIHKVFFSFLISSSFLNVNFFHNLQSITSGFVNFFSSHFQYKKEKLSLIKIFINHSLIIGLSFLYKKKYALKIAKNLVLSTVKVVKNRLYELRIQAKIDDKIVFTKKKSCIRNNVTSLCGGRDVSRKKKLWKNQSINRKKMFYSSFNKEILDKKTSIKIIESINFENF